MFHKTVEVGKEREFNFKFPTSYTEKCYSADVQSNDPHQPLF